MSGLDELLAPIDEERPGGTDVSYETIYSRLTDLREEARDGEGDFAEVVEVATEILTGESKDLTVAVWYTEARLHMDGFGGLRQGLRLVHGLLDGLWDHLFPEHPEDRAFVLDYMGDGFKARDERYEPVKFVSITSWGHHLHHFESWRGIKKDSFGEGDARKKGKDEDDDPRAPRSDNFEQGFAETSKAWYREREAEVKGCLEEVAALQELCGQRYADSKGHRPSFTHLRESLERAQTYVGVLVEKKLETDPDPPEAEAAATPGADDASASPETDAGGPSAPAAAAAPRSGGSLSAEPASSDDAQGRITSAARYLRKADPTNPAPYLVLRALRWGELRTGSGLDVRLLDAPSTELRKRLKMHLLNGEWEALLSACEDVMATPSGRGWLDLQRYVLTALDNLGSTYRPVAEAIQGEIAQLLRDLPEILDKTLMDDTPTANVETVEWLRLSGLVGGDGEADGGASASPDYDRDRVLSEATHEKALEWVASGNPRRGVELLMKRADREESPRARFITESLAASVLVDMGSTGVARPILEQLVDQIGKRNLEQWEPAAVIARPLGLLYRCLPANDRKRQQLYDDICRLDPVLAISLEGSATTAAPAAGGKAAAPAQPAEAGAESTEEGDGSA